MALEDVQRVPTGDPGATGSDWVATDHLILGRSPLSALYRSSLLPWGSGASTAIAAGGPIGPGARPWDCPLERFRTKEIGAGACARLSAIDALTTKALMREKQLPPAPAEPEFTVVIASRNGGRTLSSALEALAAQVDAPPFEVVVVDDGSTDDTAAIARGFGATVVSLDRNQGKSFAMNIAVAIARAPLLAMMDDDCVPPGDWIRTLESAWRSAPAHVAILGGPVVPFQLDTFNRRYVAAREPIAAKEAAFGERATLLDRVRNAVVPPKPGLGTRPVYFVPGANMSIRRSALLQTAGFPQALREAGEDVYIAQELRACFGPDAVQFVPEVVMRHDFHPAVADSLRRGRSYGKANGRRASARGRIVLRTELLLVASIAAIGAVVTPALGVVALCLAPLGVYRAWWRTRRDAGAEALAYPYVQLLEDVSYYVGFLEGFRE